MKRSLYTYIVVLMVLLGIQGHFVYAEQITTYRASDLRPHSEIFFSPASATYINDSTFEVPLYVNTKGRSINAVDVRVKFDPNLLSVVNPSSGKSIIGVWVEAPSYDNTRGTAHVAGTIPDAITTESGLIMTLVFRAKGSGRAVVSIADTSQVLLNDGSGTVTDLSSNRGIYTITPKPPEGVAVYSETHAFSDRWYNNNSPTFSWDKDPGVTGFSYVFDTKPTTIPENVSLGDDTVKAYEKVADGLWYFHVKALKQGVWGGTSHYLVKIDTTQPAQFIPTIDYIGATVINRFLVSFFTSDNLSGIDHYEVGVIDKSAGTTESPVFVQTESPYQLPFDKVKEAHIIVRAFDRAGNIRDGSVDAKIPVVILKLITDHAVAILLAILAIILGTSIVHYFYGHKIVRRFERGLALLKKEESTSEPKDSGVNSP